MPRVEGRQLLDKMLLTEMEAFEAILISAFTRSWSFLMRFFQLDSSKFSFHAAL